MGEGWAVQPRAIAVIGIGLLLALAATLGPPPPVAGEPGASLAVRLPDTVRTIVFTLLALSALLLLALQRPRPRTEDEPPSPRELRRHPTLTTAILSLLPLFVFVAAAWYLIWNPWSDGAVHPIETAFTAIAGLLDLLARARKPPTSVPIFDYTIAALLLVFALAIFGLMVLVALAEHLQKWWGRRVVTGAARPAPDRLHDDLDDLRVDPDARAAVIRAYGRFEHAVAVARAPRLSWQTPTEFMRTTIARLPVPVPPVERLTALFQLARFSDRPVAATARDAACDSLEEITSALEADAASLPSMTAPSMTAHPRFKPGEPSDTDAPPPSTTAHPRFKPGEPSDTDAPPPSTTAHPRFKPGEPSDTESARGC
jgi:hypothetical protein